MWVIDVTFKWLPGFVNGQTLGEELGGAEKIQTPLVHPWIQLWLGRFASFAGSSPAA